MQDAFSQQYVEHPLIWPNTVEARLYQTKIAKAASERNTLVILPTALGKTVISALVAADVLYQYRDARVLVMAPTRPLVMQHQRSFLRLLKLRAQDTTLLTGTTPPEYRRGVWAGAARIVFATPQVVRNDLLEQRLQLETYGLLVFDECHRAVKRYAYTDIAEAYVAQATYPLLLGMTASPGAKLDRALEVCRRLYIERVAYRSEDDPDVTPYIQSIAMEWMRVDLPSEYLEIIARIQAMLSPRLSWLHRMGVLRRKPEYATKRSLIEVGDELRYLLEESIEEERPKIFNAIITQSLALTLCHMRELLETQGLWTLRAFLDRVALERGEKRSYAILTTDPAYQELCHYIDAHPVEHPKLELLRALVGGQLRGKPASRMLVFTQYRDTASHLVEALNHVDGVRADRFVGQASRLLDRGLSQEEQAERIRLLEAGDLNVLVATSIAEEGLDIPAVDYVVFYEPIPSEIRYIQRRGRTGRKAPGKVAILAANDSLDMIYLYTSRRRTAQMRQIAETVNSQLHTILRSHPKPPPNPITPMELQAIEAEARPLTVEPAALKPEVETVKEVRRTIDRAARSLYLKLLERGTVGASLEQLAADMDLEAVATPTVVGAIGKLVKERFVTEVRPGRYAATAAVKATGKTYAITVEKIYPGTAVVMVDDQWKARLLSADYNGPRSLIKKNARFRAEAHLYQIEGTLCISVKKVTEIL
jgi:ERCC4-related helicase